jgi:hypothetical protein
MDNISALKEAIQKGQSYLYKGDREQIPFHDLRKPECLNDDKNRYESIVRIVVPEDSDGWAYRIMHPNVGHPDKEPKQFPCAKYLGDLAGKPQNCILCQVLDTVAADTTLAAKMVPWVKRKDGLPIKVKEPIGKIVSFMTPTPLLLLMLIEPQFVDDKTARPELRGLQKFWGNKKSMVNRLFKCLEDFGAPHFTDQKNGHCIKLTYTPTAAAKDMYDVIPMKDTYEIPKELQDKSVDPQLFAPKLKPEADVLKKLSEMGINLTEVAQ